MNNLMAAHAAAEQFAARLAIAGVSAADIAEAMTTTGIAFLAADNPEAAIALTAAYFEVRNAHQ